MSDDKTILVTSADRAAELMLQGYVFVDPDPAHNINAGSHMRLPAEKTTALHTRPAADIVAEARSELLSVIHQMDGTDDKIICRRVRRAHDLLCTIDTRRAQGERT